jgi:hypothetical protein
VASRHHLADRSLDSLTVVGQKPADDVEELFGLVVNHLMPATLEDAQVRVRNQRRDLLGELRRADPVVPPADDEGRASDVVLPARIREDPRGYPQFLAAGSSNIELRVRLSCQRDPRRGRKFADATIARPNVGWSRHTEELMEAAESKRSTLVGYASIFGVEILPEEESLESSVEDLIGFIADIDTLDLEGVAPASIFDPTWPRVNQVRS